VGEEDLIPRKSFNRTKEAQKRLRKLLIRFKDEDKVIYGGKDLTHFYEFQNVWIDATHGWGEVFHCDKIDGWQGISVSELKAKLSYLQQEELEIDIRDRANHENPVYRIGELWGVLLMEVEKKVFDRALKNIIGKSPEFTEHQSPSQKQV